MKNYIRTGLALFVVTIVLFSFAGCGSKKDDAEPITDQQLTKLSKTWKVTEVTLDGASVKSSYTSFQLAVNGTKGSKTFSFTTTGRPSKSAWPANGTFTFGSDPGTQIIRDTDQLNMTYVVSESSLQLNFNYAGDGFNARTSNVSGQWVFTFGL